MAERGTIKGFSGGMSGLATVYVEVHEDGGTVRRVLVESGFGLRQFVGAFGSLTEAVGKTIEYDTDEFGLMTEFSIPEIEEWV